MKKDQICEAKSNKEEIERINQVYEFYRRSRIIQAQWNEEHPGNRFIFTEREKALVKVLTQAGYFPLQNRKILDMGCGGDKVLAGFIKWGAKPENLYGIDLLTERIEEAKSYIHH